MTDAEAHVAVLSINQVVFGSVGGKWQGNEQHQPVAKFMHDV